MLKMTLLASLAAVIIAMAALCGCTPPATISPEDAKILVAVHALDIDPADKSALSCTVEMVRGGFFREYRWDASHNGPAVAYNIEMRCVVPDTTMLVIVSDKTQIQVRAQGIGATGITSEWSPWSEVVSK